MKEGNGPRRTVASRAAVPISLGDYAIDSPPPGAIRPDPFHPPDPFTLVWMSAVHWIRNQESSASDRPRFV
ncbi:MAG: hypothetical protein K0S86_3515 [Geminicoccaceae bacterium]|nr:hypothetical protein [Geminicoccaceae bacterium]